MREAKVAGVLAGLSILLLAGLGARFYHLQIEEFESYRQQKITQCSSTIELTRRRGTIFDSCGRPLATSDPVKSAFIDPQHFDRASAGELSQVVGLPEAEILQKISDPERQFTWLKRKISDREAGALKGFRGVGVVTEYRRRYPNGRSLGHILGFVDVDERGLEGIERSADRWLAPEVQSLEAFMDAARRVVSRKNEGAPSRPRGDVVLTINMELQRIVEEELGAAWTQYRPQSAVAIVMNPKTGAVLALAIFPDFDPTHPADFRPEARRNRILTDPYEPGSVMKSFIVARAIEKKLVTPSSTIDCENGAFHYEGRTLHDHHPYGRLTVTEIIAKSSNVGACKIGILLGKEGVWQALDGFGFGHSTGIDLAGECPGRIAALPKWTSYTLTSTPIGHEMLATPLQVLRGYCAFANGGLLVTPHVLCEVVEEGYVLSRPFSPAPRRVISAETAGILRAMLLEVVANGTATAAKVEGMSVAGKTGTTQVVDPVTRQYHHDLHISSFVGFAPAEDAEIAMIVVLDRPQGESYGGKVAAPVVGRVLSRARALIGKEGEWARTRREVLLQGDGY